MLKNIFWRIYGAFFESIFRKRYGIQSHVDGAGRLYLVDRRTGRVLPGFDQRDEEINIDPTLRGEML